MSGSAVLEQTLSLGSTDPGVRFRIERQTSIGAAGPTEIVGQSTDGNAVGGDIRISGGTSGHSVQMGGSVYIDGGESPMATAQDVSDGNAATVGEIKYGVVHIGATSGTVKIGSSAGNGDATTQVLCGLKVDGVLKATNLASVTNYVHVG